MITIIDGETGRNEYKDLFHAMLRQRARIFGPAGKNWDVIIGDGEERDILDEAMPIYVVASHPLRGSLRLLPTTGPTLMEISFHNSALAHISAPDIWEMSRLCVESGANTFMELFDGVEEIAKRAGIASIIGNVSIDSLPFYRRRGFPVDVLGRQGDVLLISCQLNKIRSDSLDRSYCPVSAGQ